MLFINRDWQTSQSWRHDGWSQMQAARYIRLVNMFTFKHDNNPKHTDKHIQVHGVEPHQSCFKWPSQCTDTPQSILLPGYKTTICETSSSGEYWCMCVNTNSCSPYSFTKSFIYMSCCTSLSFTAHGKWWGLKYIRHAFQMSERLCWMISATKYSCVGKNILKMKFDPGTILNTVRKEMLGLRNALLLI